MESKVKDRIKCKCGNYIGKKDVICDDCLLGLSGLVIAISIDDYGIDRAYREEDVIKALRKIKFGKDK